MKTNKLILGFAIAFLLSLAFAVAAIGPQMKFYGNTPLNASLTYGGAIIVNTSLVNEDANETSIYFFDQQGNLVSGISVQNNSIISTFQNLSDQIYSFYSEAILIDGSTIRSKRIYFENINSPFLVYTSAPANGSILRSNMTSISTLTNRNTNNSDILVIGPNGNLTNYSAYGNKTNNVTLSLEDGWYTFWSVAELIERNGTNMTNIAVNGTIVTLMTENRTFYVDWHAPQATNLTISPEVKNLTSAESVDYTLNFNISEQMNARILLTRLGNSSQTAVFNTSLTNLSQYSNFVFRLSNLEAGNYTLRLSLTDNAGNLNRIELGNFTVTTAPVNTPGNNPDSGGGSSGGDGRSGGGSFVNNSLNLTNLSNNNTAGNQSTANQTETTDNKRSGITGAVIGALAKPGVRAALYFIAVVLALFIIFNVREYMKDSNGNGKKNGKKASKEDKSEE